MNTNSNIFDQTILLSITYHAWGIVRKVSTENMVVDTDKRLLKAQKEIIDCDEYASIVSLQNSITSAIKKRAVPGVKLLKRGVYAIPILLMEEAEGIMAEGTELHKKAVERFVSVYQIRRDEAISKLKSLGNTDDYPNPQDIGKYFRIEYDYVTLGPPGSLEKISPEIFKREIEKVKDSCRKAADEARLAMRVLLRDMIKHMVERLSPGVDGKRKIFRDSLVQNFQEFLSTLNSRNITGDMELSQLAETAQKVIVGDCSDVYQIKDKFSQAPDLLKDDEVFRGQVAKGLAEVKVSLDKLLIDAPSRTIVLEE